MSSRARAGDSENAFQSLKENPCSFRSNKQSRRLLPGWLDKKLLTRVEFATAQASWTHQTFVAHAAGAVVEGGEMHARSLAHPTASTH